jgi:hypothetical protein
MGAKTKPYRPFLKQKIEATAVGFIEEDVITGIATQHDVVKGTEIMDSGFAGHKSRLDDNVYMSNLTPKIVVTMGGNVDWRNDLPGLDT